jgi:hypothetical protein
MVVQARPSEVRPARCIPAGPAHDTAAQRTGDKPRPGVAANRLKLYRNRGVGFIDLVRAQAANLAYPGESVCSYYRGTIDGGRV